MPPGDVNSEVVVPDLPAGPLAGWRVVELGTGVAVAWCARVLADLGAEVVLAEPPDGHPLRREEPRRADGIGLRFGYLACGKRSVVVPDGAARTRHLRDLVGRADLLVSDADPEEVAALTEALPQVAVVGVRPFGATGPHARRRAHHLTLFHASGEGSTLPGGRGYELFPDRAPLQLGSDAGCYDAGWNAAVAALAACYDALRAHPAQRVDVSVQESLLSLNRTRLNRYLNEGVLVGREPNRYGITGMLRCRDGWAQVVGIREVHWERLVALPEGAAFAAAGFGTEQARAAGTAELGRVLAAWCAARSKHDVVRILSGLGVPAGIHAEPADLLASEQLAHRGFLRDVADGRGAATRVPGPPYRFSGTELPVRPAPALGSAAGFDARAGAPRRPEGGMTSRGRLLQGVRILDFSWAAAGPYATLLLGFLGAEVIKVESTRRLDPARSGFLARYEGTDHSPVFNELNLGKRSLQLDLTRPEAVAVARQLAAGSDVVVDNFRPGVMDRLGLGAAALLELAPRLVVASSSANGSSGPEATGAGLASVFAATGGLSQQTGYADGPPTEIGDPVDYRSGTALAVGILAGLLHRERTGRGQHVDLSSREVVIGSAPDALLAHLAGVPWQPRIGNGHHTMAPHGVYPCRDGRWLALAVGSEAEWAALCRVLDRERWIGDLAGPEARRIVPDLVDQQITAWTSERCARDAADVLQRAGVPAEAVATFADLTEDPHLAGRQAFGTVEHPVLGVQRVLRPPWLFSAGGSAVRQAAPLLGADTDDVVAALGTDLVVSDAQRSEVFR